LTISTAQSPQTATGSLADRGAFSIAAMEGFEVRTTVAANADAVWGRVTTPAGINDELMPVLRMTMPASMRGKSLADVSPGAHLGRSWLLLFGVLPFDYDDLFIAELEPGHFLERSSMLSMRVWEHERTITEDGAGCVVTDRIGFELRAPLIHIPGLAGALRAVVRRLFQHRHARIVRRFGSR
jgi:ligand-binding SRPBCC domain-containing protein